MSAVQTEREAFKSQNMKARHRTGTIWRGLFLAATVFSIVMLIILLLNIINGLAGYVSYANRVDEATLEGWRGRWRIRAEHWSPSSI
jgi:hypothetical protein